MPAAATTAAGRNTRSRGQQQYYPRAATEVEFARENMYSSRGQQQHYPQATTTIAGKKGGLPADFLLVRGEMKAQTAVRLNSRPADLVLGFRAFRSFVVSFSFGSQFQL
jgi:hypothetical protein